MTKARSRKKRSPKASVAERTLIAIEHVVEASDRTAMALERMAGVMEIVPAEPHRSVESNDLTQIKLSSRKGLPCPYCETKEAVVVQRGATVFGCMECIAPLFESTFMNKLHERSWVAGAEWAEAIMRLGRPDATRDEIAEEIKLEIERRKGAAPS